MGLLDFLKEVAKPQRDVTPTTSNVIGEALRGLSGSIRVGIPATIVTYDFKKQMATVQPSIKRKGKTGKVSSLPPIYNVPVNHFRSGRTIIHVPLKAGDCVWLQFADRSLDKWLTNGGEVDPEDCRMHHLSDAVAYPGCYPFSASADVANGDDIIIKNGGGCEMRIKPNGHLQVLNNGEELMKILADWIDADIAGAHTFLIEVRQRLRTFLES